MNRRVKARDALCDRIRHAREGLITIAKGTLPLAIFGPVGYGLCQGLLSVLARAMQALAPFAFGIVIETYGVRAAIGLSAGLSLVALGALFGLREGADGSAKPV